MTCILCAINRQMALLFGHFGKFLELSTCTNGTCSRSPLLSFFLKLCRIVFSPKFRLNPNRHDGVLIFFSMSSMLLAAEKGGAELTRCNLDAPPLVVMKWAGIFSSTLCAARSLSNSCFGRMSKAQQSSAPRPPCLPPALPSYGSCSLRPSLCSSTHRTPPQTFPASEGTPSPRVPFRERDGDSFAWSTVKNTKVEYDLQNSDVPQTLQITIQPNHPVEHHEGILFGPQRAHLQGAISRHGLKMGLRRSFGHPKGGKGHFGQNATLTPF